MSDTFKLSSFFSSPVDFNSTFETHLDKPEFFDIQNEEFFSRSKKLDYCDVINANSLFPRTTDYEDRSGLKRRKSILHQDEGYVTPDQDLKTTKKQDSTVIPWELMNEQMFHHIYSWDNFGFCLRKKKPPFLLQNKEALEYVWKAQHASSVTSLKKDSVPFCLKPISLEELEMGFRHLLLGVDSAIFQYCETNKEYILRGGLYLDGIDSETLKSCCRAFVECANYFRDIEQQIKSESMISKSNGLIYKVVCNNIGLYLQHYRGMVLSTPHLHSLLETKDWLDKLRTQLQFLDSLYRLENLPNGGALLGHLYNQVSLMGQTDLAFILYYILQACCIVYYRFLQQWIFEGECEDKYHEFFIEACPLNEMPLNRKFWTRGFLLNKCMVPSFLKGLENDVFVCGKTMALLKICAPKDPVCVALKNEYPGVPCCLTNTHLKEVEMTCQLYRDKVRTECDIQASNSTPVQQDVNYYVEKQMQSLNAIKEAQEKQKVIRFEEKQKLMYSLKKSIEETETIRKEKELKQLNDEVRLLDEAERSNKLYDLRKEEERNKLIKYYSELCVAADKKKEHSQWKTRRAVLHEKRVQFFKNEENEDFKLKPQNMETKDIEVQTLVSNIEEGVYSAESSHSAMNKLDKDFNTDDKHQEQFMGMTSQLPVQQVTKFTLPSLLPSKESVTDQKAQGDWAIALDLAEEARQFAIKFKERNMFNTYNIVTGEVNTMVDHPEAINCNSNLTLQVISSFSTDLTGITLTDKISDTCSISCQTEERIENPHHTESIINTLKTDEESTVVCDYTCTVKENNREACTTLDDPIKEANQKSLEVGPNTESLKDITKSCLQLSSALSENVQNEKTPNSTCAQLAIASENKSNIKEIDMTTVYHNLRMSVMYPLLTQLKLANEAVLRLFLIEHNLMKHVECIRRYFFLLNGEYSRNLTRRLFSELERNENPLYVLNVQSLNSLLRSAVGISVDNEYTERLSFCVNHIPTKFRLTDPKTLSCLSMRYKTYWPLNIIITDEAIIKCDQIFTFLIQLQRTSWALEQDTILLKDRRLFDSPQFRQVQLHRHIMTHFITTLKNYVTATVLEESWYHFKQDFKNISTLNDIYAAHVKYVKMLLFRCLLNKRSSTVSSNLQDLLGNILVFHEVLRGGEWELNTDSGHYQHTGYQRLSHQFTSFLQLSRFLYSYLQRLVALGYQPHLAQLLTLLSANDFYTSEETK